MTDETHQNGGRLYKARGPDGEAVWVDHEELWRLQHEQADRLRRDQARRRRGLLLALAGVVVVSLALVVFKLWSRGEPPAVSQPTAPIPAGTVGSGTERSAAPAPEADPAAVIGKAAAPAERPAERVAGAVRAWADAWARRDVDAYLAGYAEEFRPAGGLSRQAWESLRRRRLLTPASIRVEIDELRVTLGEAGRAEARFLQRYSSPLYADVVGKRLELVERDGKWRIVAERALAP
ncbi:MAG: YybH family protein [Thermoanaerobaculia bacterium]